MLDELLVEGRVDGRAGGPLSHLDRRWPTTTLIWAGDRLVAMKPINLHKNNTLVRSLELGYNNINVFYITSLSQSTPWNKKISTQLKNTKPGCKLYTQFTAPTVTAQLDACVAGRIQTNSRKKLGVADVRETTLLHSMYVAKCKRTNTGAVSRRLQRCVMHAYRRYIGTTSDKTTRYAGERCYLRNEHWHILSGQHRSQCSGRSDWTSSPLDVSVSRGQTPTTMALLVCHGAVIAV